MKKWARASEGLNAARPWAEQPLKKKKKPVIKQKQKDLLKATIYRCICGKKLFRNKRKFLVCLSCDEIN